MAKYAQMNVRDKDREKTSSLKGSKWKEKAENRRGGNIRRSGLCGLVRGLGDPMGSPSWKLFSRFSETRARVLAGQSRMGVAPIVAPKLL